MQRLLNVIYDCIALDLALLMLCVKRHSVVCKSEVFMVGFASHLPICQYFLQKPVSGASRILTEQERTITIAVERQCGIVITPGAIVRLWFHSPIAADTLQKPITICLDTKQKRFALDADDDVIVGVIPLSLVNNYYFYYVQKQRQNSSLLRKIHLEFSRCGCSSW